MVDERSPEQKLDRALRALHGQPAAARTAGLLRLAEPAGAVAHRLIEFLGDDDPFVRVAAAIACWRTARDSCDTSRLVRVLASELGDDEEVALMAGTALVEMEDAAVGALADCFEDGVGSAALVTRVIGEIGGHDAVRFLSRARRHPDLAVAREADAALRALAEEDGDSSASP